MRTQSRLLFAICLVCYLSTAGCMVSRRELIVRPQQRAAGSDASEAAGDELFWQASAVAEDVATRWQMPPTGYPSRGLSRAWVTVLVESEAERRQTGGQPIFLEMYQSKHGEIEICLSQRFRAHELPLFKNIYADLRAAVIDAFGADRVREVR